MLYFHTNWVVLQVDVHNDFNSVSHIDIFLPDMVFFRFSKSHFSIYSTILCTPIPSVFFSGFPTWGSHSHFIRIMFMTRGPIEKNVVFFFVHLRIFRPTPTTHLTCVFPLLIDDMHKVGPTLNVITVFL